MKKMMTLAVLLTIFATAAFADGKAITFQQLPTKAQTFIETNFKEIKVSYIKVDNLFFKEYDVILVNGTEIEFDKYGEWESIDCKGMFVPQTAVPSKIVDHIKKNFPDENIKEIERSNRKFEVKLTNKIELEFNKNGDFLRID